jgi:hypothetical protein
MCPFMLFSGGNRAEIPQKKLNRQADRYDGDLGHKKHKNRLSERPQICRQKNQKTRQTSRQTVSRLECPRKPNLLTVCLLVCQVFWFFCQQIWGRSESLFLCFLCPRSPSYLSACLSSFFFLRDFSSVAPRKKHEGTHLPHRRTIISKASS